MTEIILGPPGTGKTTTLLNEVEAELGRGVAPDRIGYVTFTRRGAEEAVTRAVVKFGLSREALPYFRTLHSLCFRALGLGKGDVLDGTMLKRDFADYAGIKITGRWSEDGTFGGYEMGDRILFMENLARVRGIPLREQYQRDHDAMRWSEVDRTSRALVAFKASHGLLDYTDMLSRFVEEAAPPRLDLLVVDEAQDLSWLQWQVVWLLAKYAKRVIIGGDDDQAIYAWSGADSEALINMEGDVRVLGQSYRCPWRVQELGAGLLRRLAHRRPKEWQARPGRGTLGKASTFEDVDVAQQWSDNGVQPVLVLARNEYILREQVEPELRLRGVFYEHAGHGSLAEGMRRAILAWEDLRAGREVAAAEVRRVYAAMTSGRGYSRGHKTLPGVSDDKMLNMDDLKLMHGLIVDTVWHEALDRFPRDDVSYVLAMRRAGERLLARPRVRISTIHGAKGGEASHVVVFKEMARRSHNEMMLNPDDELRVWYVAVTRARERLTLVASQTAQECPWL